jgi:hypothetical protein
MNALGFFCGAQRIAFKAQYPHRAFVIQSITTLHDVIGRPMQLTLLEEGHCGLRRHGCEHAVVSNELDCEVASKAHANNAHTFNPTLISNLSAK